MRLIEAHLVGLLCIEVQQGRYHTQHLLLIARMATNHITDEQALDETLVNLVRLAGLAAAEPLFQLEIGILQVVHCARKNMKSNVSDVQQIHIPNSACLDIICTYVITINRDADHLGL